MIHTDGFHLVLFTMTCLAMGCGDGTSREEPGNHNYVIDRLIVPITTAQARSLAIDIDEDPIGRPENRLGEFLALLLGENDIPVQESVDRALDEGQVIALVNVAASALDFAWEAAMTAHLGENPSNPPCGETDAGCGQHLDGDTEFEIRADSPDGDVIEGWIVTEQFRGKRGHLTLELPLMAGQPPLRLELIGAYMEAEIDEHGLTDGRIGGALRATEVVDTILPLVVTVLVQETADDCSDPDAQPGCCTPGSDGALVYEMVDRNDNCLIEVQEVQTLPLVQNLLLPDLDLLDATGVYNPHDDNQDRDGVHDSISFGLGFTAVGARFEQP